MRKAGAMAAILMFLCAFSLPVPADTIMVHYAGYGYEEGGFELSESGDEIHFISLVAGMEHGIPNFPFDPFVNEYSFVATDLISEGEQVNGDVTTVSYNLGAIAIYEDSSFNADWEEYAGIDNPPFTFFDGELWLTGHFVNFSITVMRELGIGYYEGQVIIEDGSACDYFDDNGFTYGGILTVPCDPGIPACYCFSLDGELWAEEAVSTANLSWGEVKALFGAAAEGENHE